MSLAASSLEGILRAFQLLPKVPVLEVRPGPGPDLVLRVLPTVPGGRGCWPMRVALRGVSDARGGAPSQMPGPASPRCSPLLLAAPSPAQTPSLPPGPLPGPGLLLAAHQTAQQHPLREPGLELHGKALVKKKYIFIIKAQMVFWHTSSSLDIYQVF